MSVNIGIHDVLRVVVDRQIALFKDTSGEPIHYITDIRVYDSNNMEHVISIYGSDKSKPVTIINEVE